MNKKQLLLFENELLILRNKLATHMNKNYNFQFKNDEKLKGQRGTCKKIQTDIYNYNKTYPIEINGCRLFSKKMSYLSSQCTDTLKNNN